MSLFQLALAVSRDTAHRLQLQRHRQSGWSASLQPNWTSSLRQTASKGWTKSD